MYPPLGRDKRQIFGGDSSASNLKSEGILHCDEYNWLHLDSLIIIIIRLMLLLLL